MSDSDKMLEQLTKIALIINDEIGEKGAEINGNMPSPVMVLTNGNIIAVEFFDVPIWDSDNNASDTIEEAFACIRKEIESYLEVLAKAKIPDLLTKIEQEKLWQ